MKSELKSSIIGEFSKKGMRTSEPSLSIKEVTSELSKETLKDMFYLAPVGIGMLKKSVFTELNPRVTEITGYAYNDLIGQDYQVLYKKKEQYKQVEDNVKKQIDSLGIAVLETEWRRKDGSFVNVQLTVVPVNHLDISDGLIFTVLDITCQKKSQELLEKSEERLKIIFDYAPEAIYLCDTRGRFIDGNIAAEKLFGYKKKELQGKNLFDFGLIDYDYAVKGYETLIKSGTKEKKGPYTFKLKTQEREEIFVEITTYPININEDYLLLGIANDITDRIHSERLQKVVYNISNIINRADSLDVLIKRIQKELVSVIDTTNFFIALYDEETDTFSLPFFADEKDDFSSFPAEKTLASYVVKHKKPLLATSGIIEELRASGELEAIGSVPKNWLGVPLENDGNVIGVLSVQSYNNPNAYNEADMRILKFVSDQVSLSIYRKNSEIRMATALKKATESDRLKSAFLANMSHEIRTPMNGILGFASLLKNDSLTNADREKYISIIEKSGKRMLGIINDLIDISKIESGMTELVISDFNLNNSMNYIYAFFKLEAEAKGLKISFIDGEAPKGVLQIRSDREKLYAILTNLVKNSIKYTHSGEIKLGYQLVNDVIRFEVQDTGIGISKKKQETIFNRFVQADLELSSSTEGVGLGLAISRAYVELLGGKIWVDSEKDNGSVFSFEIPYVKGEVVNVVEQGEEKEIDKETKQKLKILVVEDDLINQRLFTHILKEVARELIIASNGAEAIRIYKERSDIDIILMDLKMPVMDGYEAIEKIREVDAEIKILALSAFAFDTERKKALEKGFNAYVSKPISKTELFDAIGKYFDI